MRKPVVDYRKFRLNKLGDPEFSHLKLLFGWVGYFAMYFLTENIIPRDRCYVVYSPLDDLIPFCEYFVIPYVGWYLLIVVSLVYFALYNVENFKRLQIFIIVTQIVAMAIYVIFPNRQDLRPALDELGRENIFTRIIGLLYTFDTSTNVCPSLHVGYSIGIASVWLKEQSASRWVKAFVTVFCILVCLSTAFIKQHSVVDAFVAIPMCILAEFIACNGYWRTKIHKSSKI